MRSIFTGAVLVATVLVTLVGCSGTGGSGAPSDAIGLTGPVIRGVAPRLQIVPAMRTVGTNRTTPLVFTAFDEYGRACADGTKIVVSFNFGGRIDVADVTTAKGYAMAMYTAGANAGVEMITATALGVTGSTTVTVVADPPAQPVVRVAPVVDQVRPSETLPVVVFVNNTAGNAVVVPVQMYSRMGGTFAPASGNSENGLFVTNFTASSSQGVDELSAIAGGTTATASLAVVP